MTDVQGKCPNNEEVEKAIVNKVNAVDCSVNVLKAQLEAIVLRIDDGLTRTQQNVERIEQVDKNFQDHVTKAFADIEK